MNEKEYLSQRVDNQIKWYSKKSTTYKNWFYGIRTIEVLFAAGLPVMLCIDNTLPKYLAPTVSLVIVVCASITSLYSWQKQWVLYRTTAESLKHEKYLYLVGASPYNNAAIKLSLLAQNVESLISSENSVWRRTASSKEGETQ